MSALNKSFRVSKLTTSHVTSLNVLSPTAPQSVAAHAASLGITTQEATKRLSLLVDEGLAVTVKNSKGTPVGSYVQA